MCRYTLWVYVCYREQLSVLRLSHEEHTQSLSLSHIHTHTVSTQRCTWKPVRGDVMTVLQNDEWIWLFSHNESDLKFKTVLRTFYTLFSFQESRVTMTEWAGSQSISINMEDSAVYQFKKEIVEMLGDDSTDNQHFYVCISAAAEVLLMTDHISGPNNKTFRNCMHNQTIYRYCHCNTEWNTTVITMVVSKKGVSMFLDR